MTGAEIRFDPLLVPGTLLERSNRFLARVRLGSGAVPVHVPSSGRLRELLVPGAAVLVQPAPDQAKRRTGFTLIGVRHLRPQGAVWVCIHTGIANRLAGSMLRLGLLPGLERFLPRPEATCGDSRLDFRLEDDRGRTGWVEVKCVTLAVEEQARFPTRPPSAEPGICRQLARLARAARRLLCSSSPSETTCGRSPPTGSRTPTSPTPSRTRARPVWRSMLLPRP